MPQSINHSYPSGGAVGAHVPIAGGATVDTTRVQSHSFSEIPAFLLLPFFVLDQLAIGSGRENGGFIDISKLDRGPKLGYPSSDAHGRPTVQAGRKGTPFLTDPGSGSKLTISILPADSSFLFSSYLSSRRQ